MRQETKPSQEPSPRQSRPEVKVEAKPQRRRFTASYKLSILEQVDACAKLGDLGALLRREGLYSSHIATWRQARDRGEFASLQPKKRGPKPKQVDARDLRITELEKQLAKECARRARAEGLVEFQKKFTALLENLPKDETP